MDKDTFTKSLETVMNSLLEQAKIARQNEDTYKDMFEASKYGLRGLLDKLDHEMTSLVLDAVQVINDKTGKNVDNETFYLMMALPFLRDKLERDIQQKEGHVCSVDKARELVYQIVLRNLEGK